MKRRHNLDEQVRNYLLNVLFGSKEPIHSHTHLLEYGNCKLEDSEKIDYQIQVKITKDKNEFIHPHWDEQVLNTK